MNSTIAEVFSPAQNESALTGQKSKLLAPSPAESIGEFREICTIETGTFLEHQNL